MPEEAPEEVVELMWSCLADDPSSRPEAKQIIATLQALARGKDSPDTWP